MFPPVQYYFRVTSFFEFAFLEPLEKSSYYHHHHLVHRVFGNASLHWLYNVFDLIIQF